MTRSNIRTEWGAEQRVSSYRRRLSRYAPPLIGTFLLLAYTLQAAPAFGACIHHQHHLIAKGPSPSGRQWRVTATIHNNGSCRAWLFQMDFRPSGTLRGSSSWGWSIPAGGHLSDRFTISAQDDSAGPKRAFYGTAGARVRTMVLTTSKGERLTVHPKLPSRRLRKRLVWLRDMRYFVRYYPPGQHVKVARLLNAQGELIYKARGWEGGFEGPSGSLYGLGLPDGWRSRP